MMYTSCRGGTREIGAACEEFIKQTFPRSLVEMACLCDHAVQVHDEAFEGIPLWHIEVALLVCDPHSVHHELLVIHSCCRWRVRLSHRD